MGGERGGSSHRSKRYYITIKYIVLSRSVMSNSLWPHGLQPTRLLYPRDSPSISTEVGCHALLQGISSQPRGQTQDSCISSEFFTNEPPGKPIKYISILLYKELHSKWLGGYALSGSEELLKPNADIVSLTTCFSAIWLIDMLSVDSSLKGKL